MKKTFLALVIGAMLLTTGCGDGVIVGQSDETSSNINAEQDTKLENEAKVTNVVDGDTIDIMLNGKEERVRLLLVDTPETKHPNKPVQPFGPEAFEFVKDTLTGQTVQVEYDGPKRDKYDRLLAYIWVDGKNFNQMLLEEGLARLAYVYDPPYTHYETFMKAQNKAMNDQLGIWSLDGYVAEDGFQEITNVEINNDQPTKNYLLLPAYNMIHSDPIETVVILKLKLKHRLFFEAAGGPAKDPHRLDGNDNDGIVCEGLK
ncbi:thermonuclease family protein [Bacillus tianshenii]|nr:thermonuclease family protein [Bacillus tianshenii]